MRLPALLGLVGGICGPDAFGMAFDMAAEVVEAYIELEDQRAGRTGWSLPRCAPPLAVAMHSTRPPRAKFCLGPWCRSSVLP